MSNRRDASLTFTHRVRDHCLCLHVQRAARALARRFDDALRPVGLTQGQFSLLTALKRAEPPSIGAVAELLALDRTTLTANLKPLARRGLVKVRVDRDDKRGRRLILTPAGQAVLAAAAPIWKRAHGQAERLLRSASPAIVRACLRELC
jgi:DNA-binding MarR family transcriptional regulator